MLSFKIWSLLGYIVGRLDYVVLDKYWRIGFVMLL